MNYNPEEGPKAQNLWLSHDVLVDRGPKKLACTEASPGVRESVPERVVPDERVHIGVAPVP